MTIIKDVREANFLVRLSSAMRTTDGTLMAKLLSFISGLTNIVPIEIDADRHFLESEITLAVNILNLLLFIPWCVGKIRSMIPPHSFHVDGVFA